MNTTNEYADVFTSSDAYATRFSGPLGLWLVNRQTEILQDFLTNIKPETVLDVGGGHGQVASNFSDKYKITVLGSTSSCNAQITKELSSNKCVFEEGDIERLKYPDASFDVVTCLRYVSHTDNWHNVISELCRVAKKAVIIDYPPLISFNILTPLLFKLKKNIEKNTRTYSIFTQKEINDAFIKNNFELKKYRGQFFFPMGIHRLLKNPALSSVLEFIPRVSGLTYLFGSPSLVCYVRR